MNYNKEQITNIVLKNLPPEHNVYSHLPIDKVIFRWFVGGRSGSSWQLKQEGENCFQLAQIQHYDFNLFSGDKIKKIKTQPAKLLKNLQKKISSPYTIYLPIYDSEKLTKKIPVVRVYDDKLAMLISLYGDVEQYLGSNVKL